MPPSGCEFVRLADLDVADPEDIGGVVVGHRERFLVPVREPLVLVTQIQRSGGSLVTQLLDGHSRLHVHPSELHIGKPKWCWPTIDPSAPPRELFNLLREKRAREHARSGYQKLSPAEIERNPDHKALVLPFIFLESLQERLFVALMTREPPTSARDVLDAYITSYFNAWVDYAGLYRRKADFWVAFIPRLLVDTENAARFFADYPDGRLVVPVRDPVSWYASAYAHTSEYRDLEYAVDLWIRCNENALASADAFPGRVIFVRFEDLVARPEETLSGLLDRLGLPVEPTSLDPTFNGMPVASDSSFGAKLGIDCSALDRTGHVAPETRDVVRDRTAETYARLRERSERPAG